MEECTSAQSPTCIEVSHLHMNLFIGGSIDFENEVPASIQDGSGKEEPVQCQSQQSMCTGYSHAFHIVRAKAIQIQKKKGGEGG